MPDFLIRGMPSEMKSRLEELKAGTGASITWHILRAIEEYLDARTGEGGVGGAAGEAPGGESSRHRGNRPRSVPDRQPPPENVAPPAAPPELGEGSVVDRIASQTPGVSKGFSAAEARRAAIAASNRQRAEAKKGKR